MNSQQSDGAPPAHGSIGPTNPITGLPIVEKEKKKVQRQIKSFGRLLRKQHTSPPPVDVKSIDEWSQRMYDAKSQAEQLFNAWCKGLEEFEQALNNPELDASAIYQLVHLALSTPDPAQAAKAAKAKDQKYNASKREAAQQAWKDRKKDNPALLKEQFAEQWEAETGSKYDTILKWLNNQ